MRAENESLHIIPRDGLRRRLRLRTGGQNVDLEITGARFVKEEPIRWSPDKQEFLFTLETETTADGEVQLLLKGLPARSYKVVCGEERKQWSHEDRTPILLHLPAGSSKVKVEIVRI